MTCTDTHFLLHSLIDLPCCCCMCEKIFSQCKIEVDSCHNIANYLCYVCLVSANPVYHELLLTVLWYGVVHTSALVRCTAARMFEVQNTHTQIMY